MSLRAVNIYRLIVILLLLEDLPSRHRVDAAPMRTTCFQGYFNALRCSPFISWFTTFIFSTCDLKCKATGKYNKGVCVRRRVACLLGNRMLYHCDCSEWTQPWTTSSVNPRWLRNPQWLLVALWSIHSSTSFNKQIWICLLIMLTTLHIGHTYMYIYLPKRRIQAAVNIAFQCFELFLNTQYTTVLKHPIAREQILFVPRCNRLSFVHFERQLPLRSNKVFV